jgi:hypothetical protein
MKGFLREFYNNSHGLISEPEALKSLHRSPGYKKKKLVLCKNYVLQLEGPLFFMPIGNPRWLPPQVIVLTQDHMGKIQKYVLL